MKTRRRLVYERKQRNKLWRRVRKSLAAYDVALSGPNGAVIEGQRYFYKRKQCA